MKQLSKRLFSLALALIFALGVIPFAALPARAEGGYTLTLDPNYDGASPAEYPDITQMELPAVSREGYTFVGWSEKGSLSPRFGYPIYRAGDTVELKWNANLRTGDKTLYAQWIGPVSPFVGDNVPVDGGYVYVNGIRWRVIGRGDNTELLISADMMGDAMIRDEASASVTEVYNAFSPLEQAAVLATSKTDSDGFTYSNYTFLPSDLNGEKLFLPSAPEAAVYFRNDSDRTPGNYFLRSVSNIGHNGVVQSSGLIWSMASTGQSKTRPMFQLDTTKVLFTSAAEGGKAGSGALALIGDETEADKKLTLLDSSRAFAVNGTAATAAPGGTVTLAYSGAVTGTNEYVSAILENADGEALYYGRLAQPADAAGTVTFTVPEGLADGNYVLKLFNEQYNGDFNTDYASAFSGVVLSVGEEVTCDVGETIEFGTYPQSRVTDEETIAALNAAEKVWTSYCYYSGTGNRDGKMQPGDWMRFADLYCNGEKYRAVAIDEYRPAQTSLSNPTGGFQERNGYEKGNTYYFRYEPLLWRVLDPVAGLILCEYAIDAQPYQNMIYSTQAGRYYQTKSCDIYSNDYVTSSIRAWLNADFYETAFTEKQKAKINTTTLNNDSFEYPEYNSGETSDNVFLLSYTEARNASYGLGDDAYRITVGTDYAKSQGNEVKSEKSEWLLRSPGHNGTVGMIHVDGGSSAGCFTCWAAMGVRPAVSLSSLANDPAVALTLYSHAKEGHTVVDAVIENENANTCLEDGSYDSVIYCSCGAELSRHTVAIPAPGHHTWNAGEIVTPATCAARGEIKYTCTVPGCGATETRPDVAIDVNNHHWDYANAVFNWNGYACLTATVTCRNDGSHTKDVDVNVTSETSDPKCEEAGSTVYTASFTADGETYTGTKTEPLEATDHNWDYTHAVFNWNGYECANATVTCLNDESHKLNVDVTVTSETDPATCEEGGKTVYTASFTVNGETYEATEEETLEATGHRNTTTVDATDSTCVTPGYTAGVYCNDCKKWISGHDKKDLADHTWNGGETLLAPNCTEKGLARYTCTVEGCSKTEDREIPAVPDAHVYESKTVVPTCTEEGYTLHTCAKCGNSYADDRKPVLGHQWSAPVWKWSGTNASATFTCANGDHPQTLNAAVTSRTVKEPTDTEQGRVVYTATVTFEGRTYTDTMEKTLPSLNEGRCKWCGERHEGFWGKIVGFFHSILYFFAHLFGKR